MTGKQLDNDQTTLVFLGLFGGPLLLGGVWAAITAKVSALVTVLIGWKVLLPADADPLVPIPGAGGAGLDIARVLIVSAAVIIPMTWAVSHLHRRRTADPRQVEGSTSK